MKILLFCPLNPAKDHAGDRAVQLYGRTNLSIFRQDYDPLDIWFSKGDNPFFDSNGRGNICHNYRKARQFVLDNGYDYLFTVEADMVIPENALSKLLAVDTDVAYGLYCFRNTSSWSAWTRLDLESGRSLSKDIEIARMVWGTTIDVAGVGLGCTLIRRNVLEKLDFRTDELHSSFHNDWLFAYDCQHNGIEQKCDTSVVCGHITLKPRPRIIWPDIEGPRLYRNDWLEGIPVNQEGKVEIEIGHTGSFEIKRSDLIPIQEGA